MKLLQTGILALPLTVTATVGLATDYEIFAEFTTVETGVNHYAVERLDRKNKKLYHCTAVLDDAETKQLTGQCTERPGFPENPTGKGRTCREGFQTGLAECQCLVLGKSTRLPGKLSSVFQTLLSAWR